MLTSIAHAMPMLPDPRLSLSMKALDAKPTEKPPKTKPSKTQFDAHKVMI